MMANNKAGIFSMNREDKRSNILRAAADGLKETGFHGTTLADIARRAGMAEMSLYYYFRNKEELVKAVIHDEQARFLDMIEEAVDRQNAVETKMASLMEAYYLFISRGTRLMSRELMAEYRPPSTMIPLDRDHFLHPLKDIIEHVVREGVRKGELRPMEDIDLLASVILSSMVGFEYLFIFHKRHEEVMGVIHQMVRTFFAGMKTDR